MKKLVLLAMASAISAAGMAQSQQSIVAVRPQAANTKIQGITAPRSHTPRSPFATKNTAAKPTATPFYTQPFNGGIPTGWSANTVAGGTWRWTPDSSTYAYNIGLLNSSTASNGWMIFDSDSIGTNNPSLTVIEGTLTSAGINCAGHATVQLSFEQYFRQFNDSCWVEVSGDGGASFTAYSIPANNSLSTNAALPNNPTVTYMDITSVAANQSSVVIRFRYRYDGPAGGGYNWLLDDVKLSELDDVEVGVAKSSFVTSDFSSFVQVPLSLVDSVFPLVQLSNGGAQEQAAVAVTATIFRNDVQVWEATESYLNLPYGAADSGYIFDAGYKVVDTGLYMIAIKVNQTGDAVSTNDEDTVLFRVNENFYSQTFNAGGAGLFLHRPSTNPAGEGSFIAGTIYSVPAGKSDTLTQISALFQSGTTEGVTVVAQLYKLEGSTATYVATSDNNTLEALEISTATQDRVAFFDINAAASQDGGVITEGTYLALLQTVDAPGASQVVVQYSDGQPAYAVLGIGVGFQADGTNDGSTDLTIGTGTDNPFRLVAPKVRLHFENATGVNNIEGVTIGDAYPNPANNELNIPVNMTRNGNVVVTLTNALGQTIATQQVGNVAAGTTTVAKVSTTGIASGVYFYTVNVDGQKATGRIVVKH